MSYEVLLLGLLVGAANYCFRYLPLRLRVGNARPTKRGAVGISRQPPRRFSLSGDPSDSSLHAHAKQAAGEPQ